MTHARFNIGFLTIILAFMTFQVGTNYYYDHYGIYGHNLSGKPPINFNQRHGKIAYLEKHKGEYNAYLLGSSRVGHFDNNKLSADASQAMRQDLNFYNLSVFSGVPSDYLNFLTYLKDHDHPMDHVLIGLDVYPLFLPPDLNKPDFRHHPHVTGENSISFYVSYLFRTSFLYLATEAGYFFGESPAIYAHDITNGTYLPERTISALKNDFSGYWKEETKKAQKGAKVFSTTQHLIDPSQQESLNKLVAWLKENKVSYQIFVNPLHPLNDAYYSITEKLAFEDALAEARIDIFHQLPNMDCLLADNNNFYDLMHYKQSIANEIVNSLYRPGSTQECGTVKLADTFFGNSLSQERR